MLCSKTFRFLTEFLGPQVLFFCVLCLYIFGGLRLINVVGCQVHNFFGLLP